MDQQSQPATNPATSLQAIHREPLEVLMELELQPALDAGTGASGAVVVEHLRLQVPAGARQAWLAAERQTWDPWLRRQNSFLGREVLWNREREEGVLLIHWASRDDWKAISEAEVAAIQTRFEATAKRLLALPATSANPFPLVLAGEALPP